MKKPPGGGFFDPGKHSALRHTPSVKDKTKLQPKGQGVALIVRRVT